MSVSFAKYLALLILAMHMASISVVNNTSLQHDLEHDNGVKHSLTGIHHSLHPQTATTTYSEADDSDPDCKSFDLTEHQMLHALNHLQFFPDMPMADLVRAPLTNTAPLQFDTQFLPLPTIDLPLRPPQSSLLLA